MGTCAFPSTAKVANGLTIRALEHMILSCFSVYESRKQVTNFIRHWHFSAVTIVRRARLTTNHALRYIYLIGAHREQFRNAPAVPCRINDR